MNRSTIAGVALALSFALAGCGGSSSSKKSPRSVLEFGLASSSISESGTQIAIAVTRTVTASGDISVSYATSDGTATAGVDYAAASGTLSWLSGDMTDKTFTVDITDDFAVEGDETVNLTISLAVGNATLGLLATAIVTILDDDVPGTLQFSASTFQVDENDLAGTATITVTRAGGVGDAVSVMYATANGTAVEPGDYTATSGTLNWTAGDGAAKTFTIDIVDDAVVEPDETLDITLMNPTGGAALGAPSAATLTIVDDDVTLQFTSATFSENEGSGMQALILVSRLGSVANAVQVGFATMNNTA
ncbi:MAG: hypothetical protein O7H41_13185, partial [Planctomycetota bacterium]|nr:hypothetical protein [Planctomycetota bacterium]